MCCDSNYVMNPVKLSSETELPARGILLVNPSDFEYFRRDLATDGWQKLSLFNSNLYVNVEKGIFVAGPSIGAPMAVLTLEKLIVRGATKLTFFGWGGGLLCSDNIGDVVVVNQCVSGEGTSPYYSDQKVLPVDTDAVRELEQVLERDGYLYRRGTSFSTDAPYREAKKFLQKINSETGVDIIDMETSAINTVSSFRGISLSILLLISDLPLSENWRMGSRDKHFKAKVRALIQLLCRV